ncbi:formimidoylglutamase [Mycoplasma sp. P36-A1]|uniref:formimidoylglutamase n=1 Tax=Mycoplasma sp. P36-A1 TaxID=3252900 RepID=UPI003C2D56AB
MNKYYEQADMSLWHGRIDSEEDYYSFRWHQYIKPLDLDKEIPETTEGHSIVIIGYKVDEGIALNKGKRGAANAPDIVRDFLCNKPCSFTQELKLYDGGNIKFVDSVENSQKALGKLVAELLKKGYFPIVIGGGHDVSYGNMSGVYNAINLNKEKIGFINFDAHFDNRPSTQSTSGTMFRQIRNDMQKIDAKFNHMTIGVQKSGNTLALFKYAEEVGTKHILARNVTMERKEINEYILSEFIKDLDHIYITVCTDVFSSAFAPGVSAPQPMGIMPDRFMELFRFLTSSGKVVSFDIAEISPDLDRSNTTSALGSIIIYGLVAQFAENAGLDLFEKII